MDNVPANSSASYRMFPSTPTSTIHLSHDVKPAVAPYTEVLLCEYSNLVKSISKLDELQFQAIYPEINSILDKLNQWLNKTISANAIEIFSTMRNLKKKAHALTARVTKKSHALDKKIAMFSEH